MFWSVVDTSNIRRRISFPSLDSPHYGDSTLDFGAMSELLRVLQAGEEEISIILNTCWSCQVQVLEGTKNIDSTEKDHWM